MCCALEVRVSVTPNPIDGKARKEIFLTLPTKRRFKRGQARGPRAKAANYLGEPPVGKGVFSVGSSGCRVVVELVCH